MTPKHTTDKINKIMEQCETLSRAELKAIIRDIEQLLYRKSQEVIKEAIRNREFEGDVISLARKQAGSGTVFPFMHGELIELPVDEIAKLEYHDRLTDN